jgi:hypothetical protein
MASKDFIGYQALVEDAFRSVVRKALTHAAKGGIMGAHHFLVSFDTKAPGVQLSDAMRERFPDEITIVLQNQYWDLKVHDDRFEVGLSFNKMPETVVVPFAAIRQFSDPSQNFGFRFQGEPKLPATSPPKPLAKVEPQTKAEPALAPEAPPTPAAQTDPHAPDQPTVVSLDKFRKK